MEANIGNLLNHIYNVLVPLIDWVVFFLVIASGYFVRATKVLPNIDKTLKILVFSLFVTIIYSVSSDVKTGVFIASYFMAFGFHSAVLKLLERLINSKFNQYQSKIVGDRPDDR